MVVPTVAGQLAALFRPVPAAAGWAAATEAWQDVIRLGEKNLRSNPSKPDFDCERRNHIDKCQCRAQLSAGSVSLIVSGINRQERIGKNRPPSISKPVCLRR